MRFITLFFSVLLPAAAVAAAQPDDVCDASSGPTCATMNRAFRHPVVVVSHGPGPLWLLKDGFYGQSSTCEAANNVRTIFNRLYPQASGDASASVRPLPKRILFVSAHWESRRYGFEISKSANPEMIYDYGGFPPESYEVVYGAKGDPQFAARIKDVLAQNQITSTLVERGYDHGVFVPMFLIRPEADIPIVSVSINDRMSTKDHFELGKALAPLRDEDTLIICSGQATHNLRAGFDPSAPIADWASNFQEWLDSTFAGSSNFSYKDRQTAIESWEKVPSARKAHPTPDHFTPFVVAMGAGMEPERPAATKLFGGWGVGQLSFATYAWGLEQ
uniref:Extradiol ring-cleavage dioxygenase class III enzyme subunit B domain-containing protein n=1 Tax=Globisporangium ultimum (strain ATCC 200006 / CBS 805.95 / DAOM BR144) TaxID=431595 RepID=K3WK35_GLOUD